MDFVNGDGRLEPIFLLAVGHPTGVSPLVRVQIGNDGAGVGAQLGLESVRIGFERKKIAVRAENFVFINGAFADFGEEKFPDTGGSARTHGINAAIPVTHVADDADAASGGCPYGETCSCYACYGVEMRA